jgi:hypothetical protein
MKVLRTLASAAVLAAAASAPLAAPARAATTATPAPATRTAPARGPSALDAPLPDTTLARVLFSRGRTDVGLTAMRQAAMKLGAHPDSLTPQDRREVLQLLIQQAILDHAVKASPRQWTAMDSADYHVMEDRLTLSSALDSALADMGYRIAARGDTVPDKEELGIMVRDSTLAGMNPVFDDYQVEMLAAAKAAMPKAPPTASLVEHMEAATALPEVSGADSAKTIVRWNDQSYTVGQFLSDLGKLPSSRRPPLGSAASVRDLLRNKIYMDLLRETVRRNGTARKPRIASALAERAAFLDVQRYVAGHVYDRVPVDSATLLGRFRAHHDRYMGPARALVVRTVFDSLADADTLARRLTLPGYAESLATRSAASGVPYQTTLDEYSDSTLFRRMQQGGEGCVLGPDRVRGGWRVLKVMQLAPRFEVPFSQVENQVKQDWLQEDGERRMRALMEQLSRSAIVRVNETSPYLTGRRRRPG